MITEKQMIVNPVPAKTWYWLRMNERRIPVSEGALPYEPVFTADNAAISRDLSSLSSLEGSCGKEAAALVRATVQEAPVFTADSSAPARVKTVLDLPAGATSVSRLGLVVPEGGSMVCIMDFTTAPDAEGTAFAETLITLGKQAHLTLVQIFRTGDSFRLINDIGAGVEEMGRIDLINIVFSGAENDLGCRFALEGKRAHARIRTGYTVNKDHYLDFNYLVPHFG
ncbi:MAG: SufD family Fe-S cluster assembly protein, partial [Lachnospiraceae bacterium]|nr:SufD family Fe-S cluster assembly protein [Lachnospiraceae bacterium]